MTDLWTMQSREDEIEFCKAHGITLPFDASHSYSRDRNLWHISHEGLELEDPSQAPNYDDMLVLSVTPEKAPDKETEITMTFEQGVPKTLNGKAMKVSEIITELNKLGGENGIGIVDIVETGTTLKENGLEVIEDVCPISARLIVNMVSMKMRQQEIENFVKLVEENIDK